MQSGAPVSRRELRESEGRKRSSKPSKSSSGGGGGNDGSGYGPGGYESAKPKKRRWLWLKITLPILLVLGAAGGAAAYAWFNYEDQVRELLGLELPTDYAGTGNGVEAVITIQSGDIGSDIATTLHDAGVTMTFDAFYDLLLSLPEDPGFQPGNYALQEEMSAQSALDALLDPENKITDRLLITEGTILPMRSRSLPKRPESRSRSCRRLRSISRPSDFQPRHRASRAICSRRRITSTAAQSAQEVLQMLVDTMFEHLDAAGVARRPAAHACSRWRRSSSARPARTPTTTSRSRACFTNRLEQGM